MQKRRQINSNFKASEKVRRGQQMPSVKTVNKYERTKEHKIIIVKTSNK